MRRSGRPGAPQQGARALGARLLLEPARRHAQPAPRSSGRRSSGLARSGGPHARRAAELRRRLAQPPATTPGAGPLRRVVGAHFGHHRRRGNKPDRFDDGIATLSAYVTEPRTAQHLVCRTSLSPTPTAHRITAPTTRSQSAQQRSAQSVSAPFAHAGPGGCSSRRSDEISPLELLAGAWFPSSSAPPHRSVAASG